MSSIYSACIGQQLPMRKQKAKNKMQVLMCVFLLISPLASFSSSTSQAPDLFHSSAQSRNDVKPIFTVAFSSLYGNIMILYIHFALWGRRKKNVKKSNTVTIFMRQHVYTTAEKHSSIFKLLLISFTHSLELMNPRDPWSQSFLALNIKPARVMLTLENPCCQYHGNFSDLLGNVASSLSSTR